MIAVLIDPDKTSEHSALQNLVKKIEFANIDFIFIGGSSVKEEDFNRCLDNLKAITKVPVVIFPGGPSQVSLKADGMLLLSLISGRNPDYLIGHHVQSAPKLKELKEKLLPTGYILLDGGNNSAVAYISQTSPIPQSNPEIAVNTAIAGELLGLKAIFIDAGSGAHHSANENLIKRLRSEINVPLIVGGGVKSIERIQELENAGADIIVIGNKIEEDIDFLLDIASIRTTKINE
ncbi:MAG: phosphoglycerol geranylgeranyltransferase [Crocinitomicaceae bacterium]|nr:phosphoglycerol geranylgeranyltransferase [Crocinitomicaceae bacterium]